MALGVTWDHPSTPGATGGLLIAVAVALLLATGFSSSNQREVMPDQATELSPAAEEIEGMLSAIDDDIDVNASEDLRMAWNDLRNDLESIAHDVESERDSMDLEGVVDRVEGFLEQFSPVGGVGEVGDDWQKLVDTLIAVHEGIGSERTVGR